MASAAFAPAARLIAAPMTAISVASKTLRGLVMALPPVGLVRSARRARRRGRSGYRFQVRNDRFDLCGLEMVSEARHAGLAVADDLPHHRLLSARRILRQFGTVERARHLRLGVADAARLIEQPHAQKLLVVEGSAACLLRPRALRRQRERDHPGAQSDCQPSHRASSRHRRLFWRAYDRAGRKGSALYVDTDLRLLLGLTPQPWLRQPMSAPAITPNRPRLPVMTIRIGTSERDGTFYSQGRALKTLFERRPALAAVEVMESKSASTDTANG